MKKAGITTIAIALIAGSAGIATAHPQKPCRQQRRHPAKQQQFRQRPARGMQGQRGRQQAYRGRNPQAQWRQLTPRQRQMLRKKFRQSQATARFGGHPQGRQFAQGQPFKGHPRQPGLAGKPNPRQLTPEQRRHIAQMHQKFQKQVRQYLAASSKKGHGKPKAACPRNKKCPGCAKQKKANQKKPQHKGAKHKPHKPAQANNK